MRAECSKAARAIMKNHPLREADLEECASLDDALAQAHRVLKTAVRNVMLDRLSRRSRAN